MTIRGGGMAVHGGGMRKRKRRRKRKKKGSGLIGASSKTWTPKYLSKRGSGFTEALFNPIGAIGAAAMKFARRGRPGQTNRFAGLAVRSLRRGGFGGKRGSGMAISGAGMAIHGAGLRGKRVLPRYGSGKRRV